MIEYKDSKNINDTDLRALYSAEGWISYTERFHDLSVLLRDCNCVWSAWDGQRLVGLIRTIGDNCSITYIQDVIGLPEFQGKGIGSKLFRKVLDDTTHIRQLVLITDNSKETQHIRDWYEKMGMKRNEAFGVVGYYMQR